MIAIIKYNAGNILSVVHALKRLDQECVVTDDPMVLRKADKVILPGVGAAAMAMAYLREKQLDTIIIRLEQPVLGICLGLQLMCHSSEEGNVTCMSLFDTHVRKLPPAGLVPHMGWNNLTRRKGNLFNGMQHSDDVYFVHSYAADVCRHTIAVCDYIKPFSAALNNNNFYATQFHPEKSASVGDGILLNFLNL